MLDRRCESYTLPHEAEPLMQCVPRQSLGTRGCVIGLYEVAATTALTLFSEGIAAMRIRGFLLAGALAVIFTPTSGLTQFGPPGGGGGPPGGGPPGGFRFDPNTMWDMFAKGKDSISRSDISDPGQQMM